MNNVVLIGRLTGEPTITMANSGNSIARLTLAVDRRFKQEGQPTADFISCVAFGKTAEFIEKYFHKGNKMAVAGHIQTGSYEKDGQKHFTTDVIIDAVEFVESKGSASEAPAAEKKDDFLNVPEGIDEELPFN